MSDNNVKTRQHRAVDEQDTLWIYIEKALDDKNITMSPGWLSTESEGVKKVSCWDWFDFKQIEENASLKAIYLSAQNSLKRNKDNASLEQYTATIYERNPENLANYVYANRMGNGDESSEDGYRYRGRGMIQLTGKDAYNNFTNVHNKNNPDDIQDFVANPDLLISSTQYGIESAFVFWFTKTGRPNRDINHFVKLKDLAKSGTVQEVTQLVNGGQNGYNDRKQRFNRLARLLGLDEE
jgi:predicted chitinase